ncbi:MAG: N-acetylmuramoyl-L-alanine amidase [Eubacterium sp.]|nr:N-acetylmuramoyl-L-alanine amidase [Eubacterium sp.]
MIMLMLISLTGCGAKEQEKTTERATVEDESLLDSDGFRPIRDYVVTIQDNVTVRREPMENAEVYVTLDKGVDLKRTGIKDSWTRVLINGTPLYVRSQYVEETDIKWATELDTQQVSRVVYIDPARQITENLDMEPISPDIETPEFMSNGQYATATTAAQKAGMKAKMTTGAIGVQSGNFEYEITLSVANYLNAELVKRGYTVYLSRTSNSVDISNAKRAEMANAADADIFIKLEAPAANDASASGILGFIATSANSHTGMLYQNNYELCYDILKTTCEDTGASRMGIYETDNLTSLNYCDMPATVISVGFLSNEFDDQALSTEEYKKKLAIGIAKGIDLYFENIEKNP